MSYDPPFIPESRKDDETLQDRVARARKAREDAADRVARRYAELEPDKRRWRLRTEEMMAESVRGMVGKTLPNAELTGAAA